MLKGEMHAREEERENGAERRGQATQMRWEKTERGWEKRNSGREIFARKGKSEGGAPPLVAKREGHTGDRKGDARRKG